MGIGIGVKAGGRVCVGLVSGVGSGKGEGGLGGSDGEGGSGAHDEGVVVGAVMSGREVEADGVVVFCNGA